MLLVTLGLGGNERRFANIGLGGLVVTVLFGVGHGMAFQDGAFVFSLLAVAITGTIGLGLLWLRERTGSLVILILAHNAINTALSFF